MRLLFEIDTRDYDPNGKAYVRPSVRAIIVRNGKIGMVHSIKYNYYKFPGGGIENGETHSDALIRETLEESGLVVIPHSIKEYGYVHRVQKSERDDADFFVQNNYYYICSAEDTALEQILDGYEADEGFTLEFIDPTIAIETNRSQYHGPKDRNMLEREARVLEMIIEENII